MVRRRKIRTKQRKWRTRSRRGERKLFEKNNYIVVENKGN
jgi:hypothetical protein